MAKNDKRVEVKQLISLGKEKGYLTYEEVHDVLPPGVVSPEHIDALMTLGDLDIDLVDPESPSDDGPGTPENGLAADYVEDGRSLDLAADVLGKTDDPVRLYLREMGTIPLLTRDGEVEIAKRIEEGQNDVVQAIVCNALATQELRLTLDLENRTGIDQEFENFGIPSESDASHGESQSDSAPQYFVSSWQGRFSRTLRLPLPMLDTKLFLKLLQLDLNAHPPGAPIVKLHLAAVPARPRSAQGGLFLPPSPEPEKLELTLARIAGMVGDNRTGALELLDTHHPEGFRIRRFMSAQRESAPKTADPPEEKSAVTALRRFRPALRADVTLESGQPLRVVCTKKKEVQGEVLWKAGPWRSSGDWWEKEAWSRDEWDIALQNSSGVALYRLVHLLLGGGWFVEGSYD